MKISETICALGHALELLQLVEPAFGRVNVNTLGSIDAVIDLFVNIGKFMIMNNMAHGNFLKPVPYEAGPQDPDERWAVRKVLLYFEF